MRARGCLVRGCDWPSDKFLDVQPVAAIYGNMSVLCDCFWSNYVHPPTQRGYLVCGIHWEMSKDLIMSNIREDNQVAT